MNRSPWRTPFALALLAGALGLLWWTAEPRLWAIRLMAGSPPRRSLLGVSLFELTEAIHATLPFLAWIALGGVLLSGLAARRRPELLGFVTVLTVTALLYGLSASLVIREQSGAPHYVYLADAFLHGRVTLAERPPNFQENDWTLYQGEWSVSFPPAPALLMLPFVALFGLAFNDVLFTLLLGALNVALFYQLLPRVGENVERPFPFGSGARLALTAAFGLGAPHWWLAVNGQVWFTAQIVATTFLLLTLLEVLGPGRPLWTGLWLALAALARPPILLALPALAWLLARKRPGKALWPGLIPLGVTGLLMGWYNLARYGNPLDLGYGHMELEELLARRVRAHGHFSLVYLRENLVNAFTKLPTWRKQAPWLVADGWGLSLPLSAPVLLAGLRAPWREHLAQAMLLAALLVAIPNLLYYNTGYLQSSYRYALDFLPFLFVLVALGMKGRLSWWSAGLVLLSIVMGFLAQLNFILLAFG